MSDDNILPFPESPDSEFSRILEALPRQERFNALVGAMNAYLRQRGLLGPEFDSFVLEDMRGKLRRIERGEK